MAIRWTANLEPDRTFEAILGLNTAASFQDFRESLSLYGAPAQNFVYADVDGHIGYQFPGYVPIRSNPDDRGDRPVRGDDGSGEWTGRIPFDDLPWQFDPEDGVIVTANNAAVDANYPYFVAQEWDPGFRAERILDQIGLYGDDGLTVDEMRRIQNDDSPLAPRDIIPLLEEATPDDRRRRHDRGRIRDWEGACDRSSLGLRRLERVAVPGPARHLRRRPGHAGPRLRRQPVLVGAAAPAPRRSELGVVGRQPDGGRHRDLGRDRRPRDGRGRRGAARRLRQPRWLVVGARPYRDLPRGHAGHERDRAAGVVLQRGTARGARDRRGRQQHLLPVLVRLPRPDRPRLRPGRHRPRLRHDQHAELSADDRHARPRWRPPHHHDRPVGQPVRPPLQRPDRAVDRAARRSRCRSRRRRSRQPRPRRSR